jgi:hypothetical protein
VGVAFDPVDADDRQQHVVAPARPLLGGEQVVGGGAEVRHHLVGIGRRRVRGVNERLDTSERLVQPVAGEEVHAQRAADADDIVRVPLEGGGRECADVTGRSGDCDPHEKPPQTVSSSMTERRQREAAPEYPMLRRQSDRRRRHPDRSPTRRYGAHVRPAERRRAVCHHRDVVTFRLLVEWAGGGNVDPFMCGVEHLSDRGLGAAQRAVGEGWSP